MKRWRWALLLFELALFAIILILPQVDLPDFTFHGGLAPIVAHYRACAPPVRAVTVITATAFYLCKSPEVRSESSFNLPQNLDHRFSILCAFLC
jgi:hypothetical protein